MISFADKMSIRMVLKSSDSSGLFEKNTPHDFTVQFDKLIHLEGYWTVALTEITLSYTHTSKRIGDVYVFSNICQGMFVGGTETSLLRKVHLSKDMTEQTGTKNKVKVHEQVFSTPYYMPVRVAQMNQIHIYIKDSDGRPSSFLNEDVSVTLHFRKYPFLQ